MQLFLISLYSLFYLLLAWRRQDWALSLLIFLLPAYQIRFNVLGLPSTLLEVMILISFGVWAVKNYQRLFGNIKLRLKNFRSPNPALRLQRYPFDTEIILILIVSWIGIAVAGFSNEALGVWKAYFFEPIMVFILVFNNLLSDNKDATSPLPPSRRGTQVEEDVTSPSVLFGTGRRGTERIVWPLALSALMVSLVAILQRFGIWPSPENFWPRVTGVFNYPNALGLYLAPLIPLLMGFFWSQLSRLRDSKSKIKYIKLVVLSLAIFLSFISLFLASSEGAIAGVLAAACFIGIFYLARSLENRLLMRVGIILMVLVFVFVLICPFVFLKIVPENKYFDFNNKTLNYVSDKLLLKDFSGEVRKQQWRETWQFLTASPKNFILGAGLSNYQAAVAPYHQAGIFFNSERDPRFYNELVWGAAEYKARHWRPVEIYMYPHSLVLNFWMELGLIGALVFMWLIFNSIKYLVLSIKQKEFYALGVLGALIVIIVHGIVDVPYFKNDLSVMFWVIVAMAGMTGIKNIKT